MDPKDVEKLLDETDGESEMETTSTLPRPTTSSSAEKTNQENLLQENKAVTEPVPEKTDVRMPEQQRPAPKKKIRVTKFSSKATDFKIFQAKQGQSCKLCNFQSDSASSIDEHVYQHFVRWFCPCGFSASTKSSLLQHMSLAKNGGSNLHQLATNCFQVDQANFDRFCKETPLPVEIYFGQLLPITKVHTKESSKPMPSTAVFNMTKDIHLTHSAEQISADAAKN